MNYDLYEGSFEPFNAPTVNEEFGIDDI